MNLSARVWLPGGVALLTLLLTHSAHADEKGEKLLRQAFRIMEQARTLTAELTYEIIVTGQPASVRTGTVVLKKPNYLYIERESRVGSRRFRWLEISDGKYYYDYNDGSVTFVRNPVPPAEGFRDVWDGEIDSFFGGVKTADNITADFAGTEILDGVVCDLVRIKAPGDPRILTYAIGQKDHLIYRNSYTAVESEKIRRTDTKRLRNIRINVPVLESRFTFHPPAGVKRYNEEADRKEREARLVKVGEEAPAFELTNPRDAQRFSLARALEGHKAVLINFWFYG